MEDKKTKKKSDESLHRFYIFKFVIAGIVFCVVVLYHGFSEILKILGH